MHYTGDKATDVAIAQQLKEENAMISKEEIQKLKDEADALSLPLKEKRDQAVKAADALSIDVHTLLTVDLYPMTEFIIRKLTVGYRDMTDLLNALKR